MAKKMVSCGCGSVAVTPHSGPPKSPNRPGPICIYFSFADDPLIHSFIHSCSKYSFIRRIFIELSLKARCYSRPKCHLSTNVGGDKGNRYLSSTDCLPDTYSLPVSLSSNSSVRQAPYRSENRNPSLGLTVRQSQDLNPVCKAPANATENRGRRYPEPPVPTLSVT